MICEFPYANIDRELGQATTADLEALQKQEIEVLTLIYPKELVLLSSSFPFKLQVSVRPFLEGDHLVYPSDYVDYSVVLVIEMTQKYPFCYPMFKIYSAYKEVTGNPLIKELEAAYPYNFPNKTGQFVIQEMIEKTRDVLFGILKTRCKRLKRVRHSMDPELSDDDLFYADNDWSNIQNLTAKATHTPLTPENFLEWARKFNADRKREELAARKADPGRDKPTGKEIFMNLQTAMFVEEGEAAGEDADGDFDLNQAIKEHQEEEGEEAVEVDEDVFRDEEALMEEMFN